MQKTVRIKITDIAFGGAGVGREDGGGVIFVPGTLVGEEVLVAITQAKKNYANGTVVEVLAPSSDRVAPPCPYYGVCGGCQYQHMTYAAQLKAKAKQQTDVWRRLGGIENCGEVEVKPAPEPYFYRNKINVLLEDKPAYRALDNRTLVPIDRCLLANKLINDALPRLEGRKQAAEVVIRADGLGRVFLYERGGRGPSELITEKVGGHDWQVPMGAFFQVNPPVAGEIARWVTQYLGRQGTTPPSLCLGKEGSLGIAGLALNKPVRRLVDAYCGVGLFLLSALAGLPELEVGVGLEIDRQAVKAARLNAEALGVHDRCSFQAGSVEGSLAAVLAQGKAEETALILDPPRGGLTDAVLAVIGREQPQTLIYISCNPPVQARDLKVLQGAGYRVAEGAAFDMFPQTAAFESVAVLSKG